MRICKFSLMAALALSSLNAQILKLDDVIVTATKNPRNIDGVSSSVIVITSDDIKKSNTIKLKDLLSRYSSLSIQKGGFPVASSATKNTISIRGVGSSGTLFLIDGQRLAGEVKNPYDLNRIPLSQIERIEIIKGPASSLYGSDAYGGIINVITKKPTQKLNANITLNGDVTAKGGGKTGEFSAGVSQKTGSFSYMIDASVLGQKGKTKDVKANVKKLMSPTGVVNAKESLTEDVALYNLNSKLGYEINDNTNLNGFLSYMNEDNEGYYVSEFHPSNIMMNTPLGKMKGPFFNVPVRSKDKNIRMNFGLGLDSKLTDNLTLNAKVNQSRYRKRNTTTSLVYKQMGYESEQASMIDPMKANVTITSYEAYLQYLLDKHLITFGSEYRDEKREATVFTQANVFNTKKVHYKSIYAQDEYDLNDKLSFIFGARYDNISNANSKTTFKLGATYFVSDYFKTRINFAQGYRTPDIRELYISKMTPKGLQLGSEVVRGPKKNKYDLKPEFINTYEIGFSGSYNVFNYDLALFYNDIQDKISETKINNYITFVNVNKAYTYGVELNLGAKLDKLRANLNFSALDSEDKSTGKSLLYTPENSASFNLEYNVYDRIWLGATYSYTGVQYYKENNFRKKADGFGILDIYGSYEKDKFRFYAGIANVTDEEGNVNVYQSKGLSFYSGISYNF